MQSNIVTQRIIRELKNENYTTESVKVMMISDHLMEYEGEIIGPSDTPYEGGRFILKIDIPETYPFRPPRIRFLTKIWHPNISSMTGAICLDVLKDQWIAAMTLRTALLSVQALLSAAEADDPQDAAVAKQYKDNHKMFEETAKHWTNVYANGPHVCPEYDEKVMQLSEMGIAAQRARDVLSCCSWDMASTVHQLFD